MGVKIKYCSNIIFVGILLHIRLFAQVNELDLKYTPPKTVFNKNAVIIINNTGDGTIIKVEEEVINPKNIFKINLGILPRGVFAFALEHSFIDYFSLSAEIGISFSNDKIQENFPNFYDNFTSSNPSAIELFSLLTLSKFVESHKAYFAGAARIYTENSDRTKYDDFIELGIRTYAYELDVNKIASPIYTGYETKGYYIEGNNRVLLRNINLMLKCGFQAIFGKKTAVAHDLFLGIGYNFCTFNEFKMTEVFVPNPSHTELIYSQTGNRSIQGLPMFVLGYTIGIGR